MLLDYCRDQEYTQEVLSQEEPELTILRPHSMRLKITFLKE
jgi:hypothetical protein